MPFTHVSRSCWCCVMLYLHIIDDESGRVVKPYPQPDNSGETITIIATLQSYYEDLEQDLDRRILMLVHPQLLMRVVQLYVAKVTPWLFRPCFLLLTILPGPNSRGYRPRRPI